MVYFSNINEAKIWLSYNQLDQQTKQEFISWKEKNGITVEEKFYELPEYQELTGLFE
jgi:hypothetical protein